MICIRYFASIREIVGCDKELINSDKLETVGDVLRWASAKYDMPEKVLCAVNQRHADEGTKVADLDEVAFFPQMTGG